MGIKQTRVESAKESTHIVVVWVSAHVESNRDADMLVALTVCSHWPATHPQTALTCLIVEASREEERRRSGYYERRQLERERKREQKQEQERQRQRERERRRQLKEASRGAPKGTFSS